MQIKATHIITPLFTAFILAFSPVLSSLSYADDLGASNEAQETTTTTDRGSIPGISETSETIQEAEGQQSAMDSAGNGHYADDSDSSFDSDEEFPRILDNLVSTLDLSGSQLDIFTDLLGTRIGHSNSETGVTQGYYFHRDGSIGWLLYQIYSRLGTTNSSLSTANTNLSNINGNLINIYTRQNTINNSIQSLVSLMSYGGNSVPLWLSNINDKLYGLTYDGKSVANFLNSINNNISNLLNYNYYGSNSTAHWLSNINDKLYGLTYDDKSVANLLNSLNNKLSDLINYNYYGSNSTAHWLSIVNDKLYGLTYDDKSVANLLNTINNSLNNLRNSLGESLNNDPGVNIFSAIVSIADAVKTWGDGGLIKVDFSGMENSLNLNFEDLLGSLEIGITKEDSIIDYLKKIYDKDLEITIPDIEVTIPDLEVTIPDFDLDLTSLNSRLDTIITLLTAQAAIDTADLLLGDLDNLGTSLSSLASNISNQLSNTFPFCIPAIVKQICGLLEAEPGIPDISFSFFDASLDLNFSQYSDFIYGLGNLTSWICRIGLILALIVNSKRFIIVWNGTTNA